MCDDEQHGDVGAPGPGSEPVLAIVGAGSEPPSHRPLRVLVADDSAVSKLVTTRTLARLGCEVDSVANGREAVDAHHAHVYDIIFMDCQMPVLKGYDATREIRNGSHQPDVPIIALTGTEGDEGRSECLAAGMNAHIEKPASQEALLDAIHRFVGPSVVRVSNDI